MISFLNTKTVAFPKVLLLMLLGISNFVIGQIAESAIHELKIEDGLSGSENDFIYRDSKGFVWISAVNGGINRFDGTNLKVYKNSQNDTTSIPNNNIQSHIFEDRAGNLIFSVWGALTEYNRKNDNFRKISLPTNEDDQPYLANYLSYYQDGVGFWVLIDHDKVFFLPKYSKIWEFKFELRNKCQRLIPILGKEKNIKGFLCFSRLGEGSLDYYEKNIANSFEFKNSYLKAEIHQVLYEKEMVYWVATNSGLFKLNLGSNTCESIKSTIRKNIFGIIQLNNNCLLLAIRGERLTQFNKGTKDFKAFLAKEGNINAKWIYKDLDNVLWLSNFKKGVNFFSLENQKFNSRKDSNSSISAISEDFRGNIWKGSNNGGILNKQGESFHKGVKINNIHCDKKERIWALSYSGLFLKNKEESKFRKLDLEIIPLNIIETIDGKIIFSSLNGGLFKLKETLNKEYDLEEINQNSFYLKFFQLKNENIVAGNQQKSIDIFSIKNGYKQIRSYPIAGDIFGFAQENDSILWAAGASGIYKLSTYDTIYNLVSKGTLPTNISFSSMESTITQNGLELWLSSNLGIVQYLTKSNAYFIYNTFDGVSSTNFISHSSIKLSTGEICFGNESGMIRFFPDSIKLLETPAKLKITNLLVNDIVKDTLTCQITGARNITQLEKLTFPKEENTISFEFVAIDFADPKSTQLQYRLKGYEDKWVMSQKGKIGFARYAKLPHGEYSFQIKAANSDGVWSDEIKELELNILPHFTERTDFRLAIFFLLGLIGFWIYKNRIRQITERAELQTTIANDKKRKAEMQTEIAENKMAALRAQMNPHFIFNSLNSINSYILNNDIRQASIYVGKFSKLMRMILNLSEFPTISLEKEIEMLKLYMEVEQLRFKKPFEFEFDIDEDEVDPFDTEVPTMLLQPFVENSIWHGLAAKEDGIGKIIIQMTIENELLKCVVKDNGIGRDAAGQIKNQKGRAHKSKALDIVKDRLRILHANATDNHTIEIKDLKDSNGQPTGTAVEIVLPLYYDQ